MGQRGTRATIIDVATAAAVSRQTVSNAVNAPHRVNPKTLQRVRAEIDRLGYHPSRAARTLKQERAGAWGFEINAQGAGRLGFVVDAFFVHLTARARRHDSHVVPFVATTRDEPLAAYKSALAANLADGFVLTDTRPGDPRPGWLTGRGIPYAAFGRIWDDPSNTAWVDVDGGAGVEAAVAHLRSEGFDRIGWLGWQAGSPVGDDRRGGWLRSVPESAQGHLEAAASEPEPAPEAAARLVNRVGRGGAIVCASDVLAAGVWEAVRANGWAAGSDFGVVGFDDSELAHTLRLSSIRQPIEQAAEAALEIVGGSTTHRALLLTPELVIRSSSLSAGDRSVKRKVTSWQR